MFNYQIEKFQQVLQDRADKKYVLFGAGIAGMGVIHYIGKEKVAAVIDNNPGLVGMLFEGVPIISLGEYIEKYCDLQILISIQTHRYYEAIQQLNENGIWNYFSMPPVLYGFDTPEEMIDKLIAEKYTNIALYGVNPITDRMLDRIEQSEGKIAVSCYVRKEHGFDFGKHYRGYKIITVDELPKETTLVVTTSPAEDEIRKIVERLHIDDVVDIYKMNSGQVGQKYEKLKKYKDIYAGKRCFVIGNGPSLTVEDLEKIEKNGEISFAANGIYHIYDSTSWRPSHYVIVDLFGYKEWVKNGMPANVASSFFTEYYYVDVPKAEGANYFHYISSVQEEALKFSTDLTEGLYSGRTVTFAMLQLACYMGIKEIYLLGVDWTGGKGTGKARHDFYNKDETLPVKPYDAFMDEKRAFLVAKQYAQEHGIKIYNATRGGELEVFERVDFDDLF